PAFPRSSPAHGRIRSVGPAVHLFLEPLQELLAPGDLHERLVPAGAVEPVAPLDLAQPALDLLEVLPDLLGLLERVVLPEPFELDLPRELRLALLDDLRVLLRGEFLEALDQLGVLPVWEMVDLEPCRRAAEFLDLLPNPPNALRCIAESRKDARGLLEVQP